MDHELTHVWLRLLREGYGPLVEMVCSCGWRNHPTTPGSFPARMWNEHLAEAGRG